MLPAEMAVGRLPASAVLGITWRVQGVRLLTATPGNTEMRALSQGPRKPPIGAIPLCSVTCMHAEM